MSVQFIQCSSANVVAFHTLPPVIVKVRSTGLVARVTTSACMPVLEARYASTSREKNKDVKSVIDDVTYMNND